jgi:NADPH-dependent 2,4-dienoyl-CoA reductase/sulfur reductase-like enzyme
MARPRRLASHPLTRIERGGPVTFHHDGRRIEAHQGETVAAALFASGPPVLSRSMRYHRARGLYCATGACTHCFLRIDGQPNQRACLAPVEPNLWSEGQNAFPNVRADFLAASDLAFPRYLDAHRRFVRPAFLRPFFLSIIRRMAGFGRVPREPVRQRFRRETLQTEILVVGAGPAGLAAADAAAGGGARVTLLESEAKVGGRLRHLPTPFHASDQEHAPRAEGKTYADAADAHLRRLGVDVRTGTRLFATYDGRWAAASRAALLDIEPQRVVVAPGALDAFPVFPGADRAGVLLATAAQRLLNVHGIVPPEPVLVYGATRDGLLLARDLVACGARVVGVYDARSKPPVAATLLEDVRRLGIAVQFGHRAAFVAGRTRPRAVVFEGPHGRVRVPCGTLVCATGRVALGQIFQQAGAKLQHEEARGGFLPVMGPSMETTVKGLYAAGSAAGVEDEWSSVLRGRIAGAAASLSLRPSEPERLKRLAAALDAYAPPRPRVVQVEAE